VHDEEPAAGGGRRAAPPRRGHAVGERDAQGDVASLSDARAARATTGEPAGARSERQASIR
jgi:hypothetical protein